MTNRLNPLTCAQVREQLHKEPELLPEDQDEIDKHIVGHIEKCPECRKYLSCLVPDPTLDDAADDGSIHIQGESDEEKPDEIVAVLLGLHTDASPGILEEESANISTGQAGHSSADSNMMPQKELLGIKESGLDEVEFLSMIYAAARFWAPHLRSSAKNLALLREPFLSLPCSSVQPHSLEIANSLKMSEVCAGDDVRTQTISEVFISGEVMAVWRLAQTFHQWRVSIDAGVVKQCHALEQFDDYDIIVIGSPRASSFIGQLQDSEHFLKSEDLMIFDNRDDHLRTPIFDLYWTSSIQSLDSRQNRIKEMAYWRWEHNRGDARANYLWAEQEYKQMLAIRETCVVVTRTENPRTRRAITLIGANHGRSAQAVVEFLLREHDSLNELVNGLTCRSGCLCRRFQILFTVPLRVDAVGPDSVVPIARRIATEEVSNKAHHTTESSGSTAGPPVGKS